MPRVKLFNSPFMLGFDDLEDTLERVSGMTAEGYPPCNIEQLEHGRMRITLAVAGFRGEDLEIERTGAQLTVSGRHSKAADSDIQYLHRGIAARRFQRSFLLADGMLVESATLTRGLLNIDISQPPRQGRVEKIPVKTVD